jgi:hypothetical protein
VVPQQPCRRLLGIVAARVAFSATQVLVWHVVDLVNLKSWSHTNSFIKDKDPSRNKQVVLGGERMIQGIQGHADGSVDSHNAAIYRVLSGFGEDDISVTSRDLEAVMRNRGPSTRIQFGPSPGEALRNFFQGAKQSSFQIEEYARL